MIDLKRITQILNTDGLPDMVKHNLILNVIADDKDAVPYILDMLNHERETSKELLLDTNLELSRALVFIEDEKVQKVKKTRIDVSFVSGEIRKHYLKYADQIRCCFQIKGLP